MSEDTESDSELEDDFEKDLDEYEESLTIVTTLVVVVAEVGDGTFFI